MINSSDISWSEMNYKARCLSYAVWRLPRKWDRDYVPHSRRLIHTIAEWLDVLPAGTKIDLGVCVCDPVYVPWSLTKNDNSTWSGFCYSESVAKCMAERVLRHLEAVGSGNGVYAMRIVGWGARV